MISIAAWRRVPRGAEGDLLLLVSREEIERLLRSLDGPGTSVSAPIEAGAHRVGDVRLFAVERTDEATLRAVEARLRATGQPTLMSRPELETDRDPAPETPCTCITANDRAVCLGWCRADRASTTPPDRSGT